MSTIAASGRKAAKYASDWVATDQAGKARGAQVVIMMDTLSRSVPERPRYHGFGRPRAHADDTILAMLVLRSVLRLSLREVEGLALELRTQQGGEWDVPDHTTLSRRMGQLEVSLPKLRPGERPVIAVDSTGLKVFGQGEWLTRQHGVGEKRRTWRKVHLAVDVGSGAIAAAVVTSGTTDDGTLLPALLAEVPLQNATVLGDGAYHEVPNFQHIHSRGGRLIARAPYNAAYGPPGDPAVEWRNANLALRNCVGQRAWARGTGYSRRSLIEMVNARLKRATGAHLASRRADNQQVETLLRCRWLNLCNDLWNAAGGTPAICIA